MGKVHHVHDRSIEHAKSRDTMAHRLLTPGGKALRSTRGFATADVVDGKPVHAQPALDVQPRHGGKAKGGVVAHSWGNTPQQIARENTVHITSSQAGKRLPKPAIHDGMTGHAAISVDDSDQVLAEAVRSGSTELPATVKES
jgi:hypothetical protein